MYSKTSLELKSEREMKSDPYHERRRLPPSSLRPLFISPNLNCFDKCRFQKWLVTDMPVIAKWLQKAAVREQQDDASGSKAEEKRSYLSLFANDVGSKQICLILLHFLPDLIDMHICAVKYIPNLYCRSRQCFIALLQ